MHGWLLVGWEVVFPTPTPTTPPALSSVSPAVSRGTDWQAGTQSLKAMIVASVVLPLFSMGTVIPALMIPRPLM